jgi:hypothetical protein
MFGLKLSHYEQACFILTCGILVTILGGIAAMSAICIH